ncbi:MAG: hypothetical protein Q7J04_03895, partial [Microcella sp.]|nr:hypothetical protein [Microcella sp.]
MTADITPRPALARFWQGLVIRPIRDGRIRDTGWPVGLAPVVALSIAAFLLAVAMILGGPLIRAGFSISASVGSTVLSLPNVALPVVLWLVVVSLSLMQGAALHVRGGLSAVLTAMSVLVVLFIGAIDLGPDGEGGVTLTPGKAVSVIASVAIVAITLARRRRTFTWWEFPVLIAV